MATQSISFERPFRYVFDRPNWIKPILMGGLYMLATFALIGLFLIGGYTKRLFQALIADENAPMPEFDFGKDFSEGLQVVGIVLCYSVALLVIAGLLHFIPFVGALVSLALWLASMVLIPVALMRHFVVGTFAAAFDFKAIVEFVQANAGGLAVYVVISIVTGIIAQLGLLACGVGVLATAFWSTVANVVALSDLWRLSGQPPAAPSAHSPMP